MSRVKARDVRGLSAEELNQKRTSLQKELQELRQKKVTGQLDKPHVFKMARRQIAQINTIQREKQNAEKQNDFYTSKQK
jgi:large subunit ribosomal protein L29